MKHADATRALKRQVSRARGALRLERAAAAGFPALAGALIWLGLCLAGALQAAAPLVASLAAIGALIGLAALAALARRRYRPPSEADARARLERDSRLDAGSLAALDDQPAALTPDAIAFWRAAQGRAQRAAARAAAAPAKLEWAAIDPWRLRFAAPGLAAAGLALAIAAGQAPDRLLQAVYPDPGPLLGDKPLTVEAWATPAAYTGAAPVSLSDRIGAAVATPPSIEVTVRAAGPVGAPRLVFTGAGGRKEARFVRGPDGVWEAKLSPPGPGVLTVVRFHPKARWRLRPGADAPPAVRFASPPRLDGDTVAFSWAASDDFGVRSVALALKPMDPPEGLKGAPAALVRLDAPAVEPREAEDEAVLDLTPHAYAGMQVQAWMVARDALGQEARSDAVTLTLQAPLFLQPLARAAIDIRRQILHERRPYAAAPSQAERGPPATLLIADPLFGAQELAIQTDDQAPRLERAPAGVRAAVRELDSLTILPDADGYFADDAVFIGLRAARATLAASGEIDETDAAADILWETAQRAEHGDSADAERAMQQARDALSQAIRRGAGPNEVQRLTDSLRRATQAYLDALTQEAIREGRTETREDAQQQSSLTENDIDEMLKEVERLANEGRDAEAQALLDQIAGLLANLQMSLVQGQSGEGGQSEGERQRNEQLGELSDAIGQQRALRDETQDAERGEGGEGGEGEDQRGGRSPAELADRQDRLRRELEETAKALGGQDGAGEEGQGPGGEAAGEALDAAGGAMQEAEAALRRGDLDAAQAAQDEALRAMRTGAEALSKELMEMQAEAAEGRKGGERSDPLGRRVGGIAGPGEDVGVPETIQRERAREILDELRRRAQDPRRPEAEREYLRRLLDRFAGS